MNIYSPSLNFLSWKKKSRNKICITVVLEIFGWTWLFALWWKIKKHVAQIHSFLFLGNIDYFVLFYLNPIHLFHWCGSNETVGAKPVECCKVYDYCVLTHKRRNRFDSWVSINWDYIIITFFIRINVMIKWWTIWDPIQWVPGLCMKQKHQLKHIEKLLYIWIW